MKFNELLILQPKTVVYCQTLEQSKLFFSFILTIYPNSTKSFLIEEKMCFDLYEATYQTLEFYKEKGYKILSFEEVLLKENYTEKFVFLENIGKSIITKNLLSIELRDSLSEFDTGEAQDIIAVYSNNEMLVASFGFYHDAIIALEEITVRINETLK